MSAANIDPKILQTRQHFDILDGLRGVAALSVVTFHFMEMAYADYGQNFIAHGFLAVDFFFCLSGFVIGYAYDNRIGKMGVLEFFKSRLIRLHPLVVLGTVLGLAGLLLDPFATAGADYSVGRLALIFFCSILMVPFSVMPNRAFNQFGLNAPAWSLFWEYVANVAYAFILCKINRRWLLVLTVLAALILCYVSYSAGNLMGGWGKGNFWDGGARIAYSFMAGLLVYRSNWIIKNKLGFLGVAILLFLAFVMPFNKWNWLTEPLVLLFYFPLLISLGAGAILSNSWKKLCVFAGNISYPIYMTHYTVIWAFSGYYAAHKPGTGMLALIIISGLIILTSFAYLVMVVYDIPVRRYLTQKRKLNK